MADVVSVLSVVVAVVERAVVAVMGLSVVAAVSLVAESFDIVVPFVAGVVAVAVVLELAFELVGFSLSSYQYCGLIAAVSASRCLHRCIHQKTSQIYTRTLQVVWPFEAISSTSLPERLVFVVSKDEQFWQSSFVFRCSLDHSAILRSDLDEDTAAVVGELPERRPVAVQPAVFPVVVVVVPLFLVRREHLQIAVVAAAVLDMSSLAHDFVVAVHTEYAALV